MEKYGTVKKCPKCGEERYGDKIMNSPYGMHVVSGEGKERFKVEFVEDTDIAGVDKMVVTCSRCGYRFTEMPLDCYGYVECWDSQYILDSADKVEWANKIIATHFTETRRAMRQWRIGDHCWYRPIEDE